MQNSENYKGGVKEKQTGGIIFIMRRRRRAPREPELHFPAFFFFFLVGFFFFSMCGNVIVGNKAVHQSTSKIHEVMHQGQV